MTPVRVAPRRPGNQTDWDDLRPLDGGASGSGHRARHVLVGGSRRFWRPFAGAANDPSSDGRRIVADGCALRSPATAGLGQRLSMLHRPNIAWSLVIRDHDGGWSSAAGQARTRERPCVLHRPALVVSRLRFDDKRCRARHLGADDRSIVRRWPVAYRGPRRGPVAAADWPPGVRRWWVWVASGRRRHRWVGMGADGGGQTGVGRDAVLTGPPIADRSAGLAGQFKGVE